MSDTGSGFDQARAGFGIPTSNFDIATVVGTDSSAISGADLTTHTPGSFDLAAAFGDMLHANATGGNFLVDILP
jgi:hypothetical protein